MNFLPDDYEAPKTSGGYMKLEEGENKIRILSKPILGWEDWNEKKPIRFKFNNKPKSSIDPNKPVRHFWSFIVFNYAKSEIQILHVTQSAIRKAIEVLSKDADWGSPHTYDLKITKKGEGINTEYSVNPSPHKPITDDMKKKFKEKPCNLEALYHNGDPFAAGYPAYTPILNDNDEPDATGPGAVIECITGEEALRLNEYLCEDKEFESKIKKYLKEKWGHDNIEMMPKACYQSFLKEAKQRFDFKQDIFA